MIPKLEQHQLLIVYYWDETSFLELCCWSKEFRSAISPVEEFFCASTYLRVNTFFVYSQLTLHTDRARTLHTLSNHSEVVELCALCQILDSSAFTQILEYIQILSNQTKMSMHSMSHSMKPTTRDWVLSDFFSHPEAWNPADRLRAEAKLDGI